MTQTPPGAARGQLQAAMAQAAQQQGGPDPSQDPNAAPPEGSPEEELSEVQARIVRIEDVLVKRGIAHPADFGPSEPDDQGAGAPPAGAPPQ